MIALPRKLCAPIATSDVRNELLENAALASVTASETIVPAPTAHRYGVTWASAAPKFEPVCPVRGTR